MKTVYFRKKRGGNFELSNRKDHTVKFNSITKLKNWFNNSYTYPDNCLNKGHGKVIKANYRLSQTYCFNFQDVIKLADI